MPIDLIGGHLGLGVDQGETGRNPQWAGETDSTDIIMRADRTLYNRVDHRQELLRRLRIALFDGRKNPGDLVHKAQPA